MRKEHRRAIFGGFLLLTACGEGSGVSSGSPSGVPAEPPGGSLKAAFLIVDGVYDTELALPFDILQHTQAHRAPLPGIEVFTVSPSGEPVTTAEGLRLRPDYGFEEAPQPDILVVPSAEGSRSEDLHNQELIAWVREAGERARYVVSLCWGAFILAEAGLLDGRAATTFPADYRTFAERFPDLELRVNVSYVHDGKALTSQGGIPSYEVALYLVDLLYGSETASGVASGLLVPWPPEPGKSARYIAFPGESDLLEVP